MIEVNGDTEHGWGPVADAFRSNFELGLEAGAACAVYADGRKVVDLWAGESDDNGSPWRENTAVVAFSAGKAATAICAHILVERGDIDLAAPVTDYWPEFGQAGKETTEVGWLLSHQAGLPAVEAALSMDDVCAWYPVIHALETQSPLWAPGTHHRYHALTYGFLVGEVVRRVAGKSLGTFFADEVAQPLQLSSWIGTPSDVEPRVGRIIRSPQVADPVTPLADVYQRYGLTAAAAMENAAIFSAELADPTSLWHVAGSCGGALSDRVDTYNLRRIREAELPASNMVTDARSLARMFAATVGEVDSTRLLTAETVANATVVQTDRSTPFGLPQLGRLEHIFTTPMSFGFMRPSPATPLAGPNSFGHAGAAGALGFADPDARIGFGYLPNRMATSLDDRRARDLSAAVTACLN